MIISDALHVRAAWIISSQQTGEVEQDEVRGVECVENHLLPRFLYPALPAVRKGKYGKSKNGINLNRTEIENKNQCADSSKRSQPDFSQEINNQTIITPAKP